MIRHLDLFAGIGGFSRAVEWIGGETIAFVEWEEWNRRVLAKHWPNARFFGDIHHVTAADFRSLGPIDLITGGYPCQPFSVAGQRLGEDDPRHLWPEMRRAIDTTRPRYILAENVDGHVTKGLDRVLAEMEADGYACGAVVVPAGGVSALHKRNRVWIMAARDGAGNVTVADAEISLERLPGDEGSALTEGWDPRVGCEHGSYRLSQQELDSPLGAPNEAGGERVPMADANGIRQPQPGRSIQALGQWTLDSGEGGCATVDDTQPSGLPHWHGESLGRSETNSKPAGTNGGGDGREVDEVIGAVDPCSYGFPAGLVRRPAARSPWDDPDVIRAMWADGSWELDLPRVVAEEAERRQKLQGAGNAIVPLVAYEILRVMLEGDHA